MSAEARAGLSLAGANFSQGIRSALKDVDRLRGGFKNLAVAGAGLIGITSVAAAVAVSCAGLKDALDLGGELTDMSAQTNIAADSLMYLRREFDASENGIDGVQPAISRLQKALSGVNDEGDDTSSVFAKLGLNTRQLLQMSPDEQFNATGKAIASIKDPADRATAAIQIFGRSGAQLLSLFRDGGAIEGAKAFVGSQAEILKRNAAEFDSVSDVLGGLNVKRQGFFVGLADSILPELKKASGYLAELDFAPVGQRVGASIANSFRSQDTASAVADLGGRFIRVMTSAAFSVGDIIAATLTSAFARPIAELQARVEAALAIIGNKERPLSTDEAARQRDLAQKISAAKAQLKTMKPDGGEEVGGFLFGAPAGGFLKRKSDLQQMEEEKAALDRRSNANRDLASFSIGDRVSEILKEGVRTGLGDGKTAGDRIADAMKQLKEAAGREFPAQSGPQQTSAKAPAALGAPFLDATNELRKATSRIATSAIQSIGGGGNTGSRETALVTEAKRQTDIIRRAADKQTNLIQRALQGGIIRVVPVIGH